MSGDGSNPQYVYNFYFDQEVWNKETYHLYTGLTDSQLAVVDNVTNAKGKLCMLNFFNNPYPEGLHCNSSWDEYICWETTPANTTVSQHCPYIPNVPVPPEFNSPDVRAYRTCNEDGMWSSWTNYTVCGSYYKLSTKQEHDRLLAKVMVNIYFYGSLVSLILLTMTLFIFSYFRTLQCSRLSIHKNLVASFILRSLVTMITYGPMMNQDQHSYMDVDWVCKLLIFIHLYSYVANIFWMFVEGLFLHNRIAVTVFHTDAPFKVFHFVGWVLPGLILTTWAVCMHFTSHSDGWRSYYKEPYVWLVMAPCILALTVSAIFLVNIIRILITRLRANNTLETDQVRKAVKATVVLFPLLGASNMIFFVNPPVDSKATETAYRIINAFLQSSQGIFVSVIYCFMNAEVRVAIRKKWLRYQNMRMGRSNTRRQSCRTSASFMSTSEGTNLSLNHKGALNRSASAKSQPKHKLQTLSKARKDTVNPERPITSSNKKKPRVITSVSIL